MSSDRVYRRRLLLEEYGPEIIYIKGIDNTLADSISRLLFSKPAHSPLEEQQNWMIQTKCWCRTKQSHKNSKDEILNYVFAHRKDDDEIFPLTVDEIAQAQKKDKSIQRNNQAYELKLVENIYVLCAVQGWTACHP